MVSVLFLPFAPVQAGPLEIRDALVVSGVAVGGRVPVVQDAIVAQIVRGEFRSPVAGTKVIAPSGREVEWKSIQAGENGTFEGGGLAGSAYVYATVTLPKAQTLLLDAKGHSLVYVNGVLRTGDPYGYGYLKVPVSLKAGKNEFLFSVGRGSLKAQLVAPKAAQQFETGDLTLPDVIPTSPKKLFGAVVVLNNTAKPVVDLNIVAGSGKSAVRTAVPSVPAFGLRKVRFDFSSALTDVPLNLVQGKSVINSTTVTVRHRKAGETYRKTFVSDIDGSVQYCAVNPSSQPSKENGLILSLHGASVEAQGQADAYSAKPWATLVAATNRRPFGFDWEDWGRLDALEVLGLAQKEFPHDPKRVVLTGHSMGGHGTWSIGSLFPAKFAATAPSAGWISFWTYAGGWTPTQPTETEKVFFRAMSPSDTLARIDNLKAEKVYILHGDADDNVPVDQARTMSEKLREKNIPFSYHEEKGAGHWWGNQCVDYPDLMSTLEAARISDFQTIDFTTPDPSVSNQAGWVTLLQQEKPREMSRVATVPAVMTTLSTTNVRALRIERDVRMLAIDGQEFLKVKKGMSFLRIGGKWKAGSLPKGSRQAGFSGPLKEAFRRQFVLVYGTEGSAAENAWAANKAKYDAETFYYRGNGSVEVVSDKEFMRGKYGNRNVIVYGNAGTNAAWSGLLSNCPVSLLMGEVSVSGNGNRGDDLGAAFVYPSGNRLVGAIGGTGLKGMRLMDRMPIFTSGTAYPDWAIFGPDCATKGSKGILGAGFFGPKWEFTPADAAWID